MNKQHQKDCNWEKTTNEQCEYKDTHFYCPHPEHACTCVRETMTSTKKGVNIEPYLRSELEKGNIDFSVRARIGADGYVYIYIHPTGKDGETMDYEVNDDQLFLRY